MSVSKLALAKGSYLGLHAGTGRFGAGDAIAAGATNNYDIDVSDFDGITVAAAISAGALADLGLTVEAFDSTGTVIPVALTTAVAAPTQVLNGGKAYGVQQYDVRGIQQIRVAVKNNNAGAQTVTFVDVFGAVTGVDY